MNDSALAVMPLDSVEWDGPARRGANCGEQEKLSVLQSAAKGADSASLEQVHHGKVLKHEEAQYEDY